MDRRLMSKIAQEAHTMGRIYEKTLSPINPREYSNMEKMIDRFIEQHVSQPEDSGDCKHARVGVATHFEVCQDCNKILGPWNG